MSESTVTAPVAVVAPAFATAAQYAAVLEKLGLTGKVTTLAGWHRVDFAKGVRIYIARSKTIKVIALAGFTAPASLAELPEQGKYGTVEQHVRLDGLTPEQMVERFEAIVNIALAAEAVVKAPKAKPAAKVEAGPAAQPAGMTEEEKAARRALIAKVAAEKGVEVSKNA